jgi:capsid protein
MTINLPQRIVNKLKGYNYTESYLPAPVEDKSHVIQSMGDGISASFSGFSSSSSKYPGGMSRQAPIVIKDHYETCQQVRDLMDDSVELRALVETQVDTIVDSGLKAKPTPQAEMLGITPEAAEEWGENVAIRFHLWASSKKSHRSRINNLYQNQRFWQLLRQRDNDIFARFYYGRDWDQLNPLQIEFIEKNTIRGYAYTSTYGNFGYDDGIIRDAAGRETNYKIWTYDNQTGKYSETTIPAVGEKSGRIMIIHGFSIEYPGQTRGFTNKIHLIQNIEHLEDFKLSVIQKAINQASFFAAIENSQQDASNPVIGRLGEPVVEYGSDPQPALDAQNVTSESTEPIVNWNSMPEATFRQPGATLVGNLRQGDTWKNLSDTSPSAEYDAFVNSFFASICASTGWGIELVLKKFNANYSASRAMLIMCWRKANIERAEMITDFLSPVYEMWLSEEIASGRVSAPGWNDPQLRAAWLCCEWSGSPMPDIDPLKSMESAKLAVELSAETLDDVARNYNGSSGKSNRIKNARQFKELPESPFAKQQVQPKQQQQQQQQESNNNGES